MEINFALNGIPIPAFSSDSLDFGLDSTSLSFTISNSGKGTFSYLITTSQKWITVNPSSGDVTNETDNITVTIIKTGLSDNIFKETIKIVSVIGDDIIQDIIDIYLNGVMDIDGNYYEVVEIGTKTWMAENLNVGNFTMFYSNPTDNHNIEKLCYNNNPSLCETYGGLYQWFEMMQYNPLEDTGQIIGTTQGICPKGWHIPTTKEWRALVTYLGGEEVAGGKLKESGTSHWESPNSGATNKSGFSALPAGVIRGMGANPPEPLSHFLHQQADFYSSTALTSEITWPFVAPLIWELY